MTPRVGSGGGPGWMGAPGGGGAATTVHCGGGGGGAETAGGGGGGGGGGVVAAAVWRWATPSPTRAPRRPPITAPSTAPWPLPATAPTTAPLPAPTTVPVAVCSAQPASRSTARPPATIRAIPRLDTARTSLGAWPGTRRPARDAVYPTAFGCPRNGRAVRRKLGPCPVWCSSDPRGGASGGAVAPPDCRAQRRSRRAAIRS